MATAICYDPIDDPGFSPLPLYSLFFSPSFLRLGEELSFFTLPVPVTTRGLVIEGHGDSLPLPHLFSPEPLSIKPSSRPCSFFPSVSFFNVRRVPMIRFHEMLATQLIPFSLLPSKLSCRIVHFSSAAFHVGGEALSRQCSSCGDIWPCLLLSRLEFLPSFF